MFLRASSIHTGEDYDVSALTSDQPGHVGVEGEEILLKFADSAVRRDEPALVEAREAIEVHLGREALVEAAATVAAFQRFNRVADGAGISLDDKFGLVSAGLQAELRIEHYASAANTRKPTGMRRVLAWLMRPLGGLMLRAMQRGILKAKARSAEGAGS